MLHAGIRKRLPPGLVASATVVAILVSLGVLQAVGSGSPVITSAAATGESTSDGVPVYAGAAATPSAAEQPATTTAQIKNVVLLLADDLDWALFDQIPRLRALREQGTTLSNFVVTDSLCCPSRSSIMRSQFVHNHGVLSNVVQSGGGWETFFKRHLERDGLPTWLKAAGAQTALVGKYLNGFPKGAPTPTYVPPGWDHFVTALAGNEVYGGYDYVLTRNGTIAKRARGRAEFVNDVLTRDATEWLAQASMPFFLEFASYSPHVPAPVAERNLGSHAGTQAPRTPSFNATGIDEPAWLRKVPTIRPEGLPRLDDLWTRRLESAESIADSYDALVAQLKASGHDSDTLIIVTSDNGYHVGAHRLPTGKQTAYHEDTIVPAVLIGPGITPGAMIGRMTSTIDLAPTIADLMGASVPTWADGRSLLPLLTNPDTTSWRTGILVESLAGAKPGDPDYTGFDAPAFHALRTENWLYVDYERGETALYDLNNDPYEINNIVSTAALGVLAALREQLAALERCAGPSCRVADSMPIPPGSVLTVPGPSGTASPEPTSTASPVG